MSDINRNLDTIQEETMEQAIERLMAGESLGTILASSGPDSEWLEPLLVLASGVRDLREAVPVPPAQASLAQFLADAERIAPAPPPGPARLPWWERLVNSLWLPTFSIPRLATTALTAALVVIVLIMGSAFFLGADSAAAAQGILPGQALYPFKRLGEEVYLRLPQSHESRSARSDLHEQRRRDEVHLLLGHHLEASVAFRGIVDTMGADQIVVSGMFVEITGDTQVEGPLASGDQVLIVARTTRDGTLIAVRAVVEGPEQPVAAPAATDTLQPTATPMATPSATAMPAAVDTVTPAREATPTPEPEPTATPTIKPTDAPAPAAVDTREPKPEPTEEPSETPDEADNENADEGDQNDNSDETEQNDNGDESNDNGGGDGGNDNSGDDGDSSGDGNDSNDNGASDGGDDSSDSGSGSDSSGGDDGGDSEDHSGSGGGDNDNDNSTA